MLVNINKPLFVFSIIVLFAIGADASLSKKDEECKWQDKVPEYGEKKFEDLPTIVAESKNSTKFLGYIAMNKTVVGQEPPYKTIYLNLTPKRYSELQSKQYGAYKEIGTDCANIAFSTYGSIILHHEIENHNLMFCEGDTIIRNIEDAKYEKEFIVCTSPQEKVELHIKLVEFKSASQ